MEIYSLLRKKKIESLLSSLDLSNIDGTIADSGDFEYSGKGKLFISSSLGTDLEGIRYGSNIRAIADNLYADAYDPSIVFSYSDEDTASLAYTLAKEYGIPLSRLGEVCVEDDMFYLVHGAGEIRNIIRHRSRSLRTMVIFSFDSYDDMPALASAFQNVDILFLLTKGGKDEKAFKKALDRIIFSPVIKRLSAVIEIKSIDDIIGYITPGDVVFEIELRKEEL